MSFNVGGNVGPYSIMQQLGPGNQASGELRAGFRETLYEAELTTYLSVQDLALVEQPNTMLASARHAYYNGNTQAAHTILNQVFTLRPHMAEASLLQAEMDANEGKTFDAKQILNILLADLNMLDWVREMAQNLSNKIP